ncbi:hypothetical protein NBRC110019_25180 [Neptunitalea chrysea]|uniref:Uncharacterized protein n=1 Tax=Neptunitalea chrysea TaxID=1647581 RepID=A0A9W6B7V7_9FLAO|nr:hypothetical protein NBRC110019_25180 [Neptunitalea chrysea]
MSRGDKQGVLNLGQNTPIGVGYNKIQGVCPQHIKGSGAADVTKPFRINYGGELAEDIHLFMIINNLKFEIFWQYITCCSNRNYPE